MARLLIIEDSATQAEALRLVLEDAGFELEVARTGEAGLDLVRDVPFELVVSDIVLPGMDGYAVCRALKDDPARRHVRVVLLTSVQEPGALVQALECGADAFITKPYEPDDLVQRISSLLTQDRAHARASSPELLLFGERLDASPEPRQMLSMLASAFEETARRTRELEAKNEELLRIQRQKDELSSFIVHDLKTPLNDIAMRLQLLQRRASLSESERRSLSVARSECAAMNRMVLNLLDVSHGRGELVPRREPVRVGEVFDEVIATMTLRADSKGQRIVCTEEGLDITVTVDRVLVVRALENLVDNSIKYAPEETRVELLARRSNGVVELAVSDEGPGVPEAQRRRIFDTYAQLDRDSRQRGRDSRGLGLAFCRLAIEAHEGTIEVEDREPTGALFVIRLPAPA